MTMQHDVFDEFSVAFAGVEVEPARRLVRDLAMHRLRREEGGSTAPAMRRDGDPQPMPADPTLLLWHETTPPRPGTLGLVNPSSWPIVVDAGDVVDGGWSARAVLSTGVVPAGAALTVPVEPIGARWRYDGPPRWCGSLRSLWAAPVLLAMVGEAAAACSAWTLLWSVDADQLVEKRVGEGRTDRGWLLVDGDGILAARLSERLPAVKTVISNAGSPALNAARPTPWLADALVASLRRGDLVGRMLAPAEGVRDIVVVAPGMRLVDRIAALNKPDAPS